VYDRFVNASILSEVFNKTMIDPSFVAHGGGPHFFKKISLPVIITGNTQEVKRADSLPKSLPDGIQ